MEGCGNGGDAADGMRGRDEGGAEVENVRHCCEQKTIWRCLGRRKSRGMVLG